MNLISTRTHGILDYLMGIILIASPWAINFSDQPSAFIMTVLGLIVLAMATMTDYELGLIKIIPMKAHLAVDILSGLFLAASPWIFGFKNDVYIPHLILGIVQVCAAILSQSTPAYNYNRKKPADKSAHNQFKL